MPFTAVSTLCPLMVNIRLHTFKMVGASSVTKTRNGASRLEMTGLLLETAVAVATAAGAICIPSPGGEVDDANLTEVGAVVAVANSLTGAVVIDCLIGAMVFGWLTATTTGCCLRADVGCSSVKGINVLFVCICLEEEVRPLTDKDKDETTTTGVEVPGAGDDTRDGTRTSTLSFEPLRGDLIFVLGHDKIVVSGR